MKNFFPVALAMFATLSASAITPVKVFDRGSNSSGSVMVVLPAELSYNEERPIFLTPDFYNKEELSLNLERINTDLDVVETFNIRKATAQTQTVITGPALVSQWSYDMVDGHRVDSAEAALQEVQSKFPNGFQTVNLTNSWIIYFKGNTPLPQDVYPYNDYEAWRTYMKDHGTYDAYAVYQGGAGNWIQFFAIAYEYQKIDTDTMIEYSNTTVEEGAFSDLTVHNQDTYMSESFPVTQMFFNDDEEYEYIVPKYGEPETKVREDEIRLEFTNEGGYQSSSWVTTIKTITSPKTTGYEVRDARTNAVIASFEAPSEYLINPEWIDCSAYIIGGVRYFVLEIAVRREPYVGYYSTYELLYKIGNPSGIYTPDLIRKVSVSPTLVNQGENIIVRSTDGSEISSISLVGLNGQTERQINENRSRNASINTSDIPAGMHIVRVHTADGINHTQKVIVK